MSPTPNYEPPQQRSGLMTALVAGAIIALVAANIYLYVQIDHLRTDTTANLAKMRESILAELGNLRDASSVNTASQAQRIETLKAELAATQNQARTLSSQAKAEAKAHAEQLAKQLQVGAGQDAAAGQHRNQRGPAVGGNGEHQDRRRVHRCRHREDQSGGHQGRIAEDHRRPEIGPGRPGRAERPDRHQRQRTGRPAGASASATTSNSRSPSRRRRNLRRSAATFRSSSRRPIRRRTRTPST